MDNLVRNPKCGTCKSYWKPDETDILTSGLLAKCCKKCRIRQKELRENRDYSKGKIYVVKSLTSPEIYVGSTINTLDDRMIQHRADWNRGVILGLSKEIVKNIDAWFIELYENYPCNKLEELTQREGIIIREIGTLNKRIAGRTIQEYRIDNADKIKEYSKKYRIENADKIKQNYIKNADKIKQNYIENADKIKQNYIENADKIKQNYIKNADKLNKKSKEYYIKNTDKIKAQQKQYYLKCKLAKSQITTE